MPDKSSTEGELAALIQQRLFEEIDARKKAEDINLSTIRTLESLQRVSDAINSPASSDKVLDNTITIIREIFATDRAWLLYPCDPETDFFEVPVEATLSQYPGALALKQKNPISPESVKIFREVLVSEHPVVCCPIVFDDEQLKIFSVRSLMVMAIRPMHGKPWMMGLHQCSHERQWSDEERKLFEQIGLRMSVLLGSVFQDKKLRTLSSAVEQAGESVMITDRQGAIEYVNPAFTTITGYSADEVLGKDPSILKSDAQDPAYYKELWETISQGEVWSGTLIDRKKDGSFYPAMMSVAPIHDDNGIITHFVATHQDMTQYKLMEKQFFEAQKLQAIGTLAGGIAHDFNNMLAAVQGNVYLARRGIGQNVKLQGRLDNIETLIDRSASMIRQLLTYARKDQVSKAPFSLNSFMKEGFKIAGTALPENIEHICDLCQDVLIVNGDATQLQQMLMNLLINARDAVADITEPIITCRLRPYVATDDFLRKHPALHNNIFAHLSVSDNGCGITRDNLNKIFEPFFTTKGVGKGTGLGLAMVYGSIKTHNGVIEVESKVGSGTAFHVYLPLDERRKPLEAIKRPTISHGQSETILLVDDETDLRTITYEVLESMGYKVLEAADGEAALQIIGNNRIDLLITDIVMPVMGGIELAREVRNRNQNMPIIFITGYDREQTRGLGEEINHCTVLNKPFEFESLSRTIHHMLND